MLCAAPDRTVTHLRLQEEAGRRYQHCRARGPAPPPLAASSKPKHQSDATSTGESSPSSILDHGEPRRPALHTFGLSGIVTDSQSCHREPQQDLRLHPPRRQHARPTRTATHAQSRIDDPRTPTHHANPPLRWLLRSGCRRVPVLGGCAHTAGHEPASACAGAPAPDVRGGAPGRSEAASRTQAVHEGLACAPASRDGTAARRGGRGRSGRSKSHT